MGALIRTGGWGSVKIQKLINSYSECKSIYVLLLYYSPDFEIIVVRPDKNNNMFLVAFSPKMDACGHDFFLKKSLTSKS